MIMTTGENAAPDSISFQCIGDGTSTSRTFHLSEFPFNFSPGKVPQLVEAIAQPNDDIDPPITITTATITEGTNGLDMFIEFSGALPVGTILNGPLQQVNINLAW